jgi:hypothetical protein
MGALAVAGVAGVNDVQYQCAGADFRFGQRFG